MPDHRGPPPDTPARNSHVGRRLAVLTLVFVLVAGVAVGIVAWRHDTSPTSRCGPVVVEAIDPQSSQHLLPNATEPDYRGDPPTSGPHQMGVAVEGAQDEPLSRPVQVGILERGSVLVQYPTTPDRSPPMPDAGTIAQLRSLGGPDVVVAPSPTIDAVVATAWGRRLPCADADTASLQGFVDQFAGLGPRMGTSG